MEWLSIFDVDFENDDFCGFLREEMSRLQSREIITNRQLPVIKEFIESQ